MGDQVDVAMATRVRRCGALTIGLCVLAGFGCMVPERPGKPTRTTAPPTSRLPSSTAATTTWRPFPGPTRWQPTPRPTSSTTSTTRPRCSGATGRCPRDITADLALLGIRGAAHLGLADNGDIVGSDHASPGGRGFRAPARGTARLLPGVAENATVFTTGVSPNGDWVAGFSESGGGSRAVIWDQGDRMIDVGAKLPNVGETSRTCQASDVNDEGQIIGRCLETFPPDPSGVPALVFVAYVWSNRTDQVVVLNPGTVTPPIASDKSTWPRAINNRGVIAGTMLGDAVRWWPEPDGTYRREDLGRGSATAINAAGDVIGALDGHAVMWPAASSVPVRLPGRRGAPDSDRSSSASDISDSGVIVGSITTTDSILPVRWPASTTQADTLDPDGGSAVALAVNAHGTVVGSGTRDPSWRVLVWDP
jgi:uncharacterized membrane protein